MSNANYPNGFSKTNCYISTLWIEMSGIKYFVRLPEVSASLRDTHIQFENRNASYENVVAYAILEKLPI